jgi:hypothetical protein
VAPSTGASDGAAGTSEPIVVVVDVVDVVLVVVLEGPGVDAGNVVDGAAIAAGGRPSHTAPLSLPP